MIELTRNQIAQLRGCTPSTISRAHLPRTDGGKYNLLDEEVWSYVVEPSLEERVRELKRADSPDLDPDTLDNELKRADIALKERREQILSVQYEKEKQNLIPVDLIALWMGYFSAGIRNNFLQLGNKVARGDKKLRDRIEKETTKAIEKTLENSKARLRGECEKIIKEMEG